MALRGILLRGLVELRMETILRRTAGSGAERGRGLVLREEAYCAYYRICVYLPPDSAREPSILFSIYAAIKSCPKTG